MSQLRLQDPYQVEAVDLLPAQLHLNLQLNSETGDVALRDISLRVSLGAVSENAGVFSFTTVTGRTLVVTLEDLEFTQQDEDDLWVFIRRVVEKATVLYFGSPLVIDKRASDSVSVNATEQQQSSGELNRADSLSVNATEQQQSSGELNRADSLSVNATEQRQSLGVADRTDSVSASTTEASDVQAT